MQASELGLETLDLARVHDAVVAVLKSSGDGGPGIRRVAMRAEPFFMAAVAPIERTHDAATTARSECARLRAALTKSENDLGDACKRLDRAIQRHGAGCRDAAPLERENRRLIKKSGALEDARRALVRQLLTSQDDERKRISRDLHDALGQTLAGAHIALARLTSDAAASSKELRANVAQTRRLVQRSMKTVHRFATALHPAVLDDLGLVSAVRSLTEEVFGSGRVRARLTVDGDFSGFDSAAVTTLYRVVQEALNNVRRHARATNVRVVLRRLPHAAHMEVSDDGRSFDVGRVSHLRSKRTLGLLCMRERMEMLGGTLVIESTPGIGTTVRAEIPVSEPTHE